MVFPSVEIGDGSVVGVGSSVTKLVLPGSLVAGNPARMLQSDIAVGEFGRFAKADETEAQLAAAGLT